MSYDEWKTTDLADDYDEPDYGEDEEDMNAKEILTKAKTSIETKGWAQGAYCDDKGGLCMYGAIYDAVGMLDPESTVSLSGLQEDQYNELRAADMALVAVVGNSLVPFNDAPGRKVEEVYDVFDKAIASLGGGVK